MRLRRKTTIAVLALLAMAVLAWAYWTTTGTGSGSATARDLQAATISAPATSEGSHDVTWDQQATTGDATLDTQITYTVERKEGAGSFDPIASGPCSGDLPHGTTTCNDTVEESGTYTYRVVAVFNSWTATSTRPRSRSMPTTPFRREVCMPSTARTRSDQGSEHVVDSHLR